MNRVATIDRKGILSFLLLAFGITFAYEGCLIGSGINNMNFGLAPRGPLILVGFNYPGYPILGVFAMIGLTTTLGFYINEMTVRHRSSILAGWIHGAFNGQFYGVWRILFPNVHPLLGGVTGLIGMMVWATLGLAVARKAEARPDGESGTPVEAVAPPNAASPHRDKGRFWNP